MMFLYDQNTEYSYDDLEVIKNAQIIINTTPVGTDDLKAKPLKLSEDGKKLVKSRSREV